MTIDEAIEQFKYDAECNRADLDFSYAEHNEQITEWLEELKELRATFCGYSKEDIELNRTAMYNKAIDDFIHECDRHCGFYNGYNKNLTREDILMIAEQLKVGV